eukprot:UN34010
MFSKSNCALRYAQKLRRFCADTAPKVVKKPQTFDDIPHLRQHQKKEMMTLYRPVESLQQTYLTKHKLREGTYYDGTNPVVLKFHKLINKCKTTRDWRKAIALVDDMKRDNIPRDIMTYVNAIHVCMKCMKVVEAEKLFNELRASKMKLNACAYSTGLSIIAKGNGTWKDALKLLEEAIVHKQANTVYIQPQLMLYPKERKSFIAMELLEEMKESQITPNLLTYNALINCHAKYGGIGAALQTVDLIKKDNLKPDITSYNSLLSACSKRGSLDRAKIIFEGMKNEGIHPDVITYNTMMTTAIKAEQIDYVDELYTELKETGIKANEILWTTLIGGEKIRRNWKGALNYFNDIINSGIKNTFCMALFFCDKCIP